MNKFFASIKKSLRGKKFKYGGYAVIVTIIGIAAVVLFNVGLTTLEDNFDLKIDTSQNKKYTLTDQTKDVLNGLEKDIYVYTLYTPGNEEDDIVEIINKFKGASSRIHVENHDPDKEPGFMTKFSSAGETVAAGSVIVSNAEGNLFRVLDQSDLYEIEYDSSYNPVITQIKVESSMTIAMNYISIGYMPTAYVVTGHGELDISALGDINTNMSDANYSVVSVNIGQTPDKLKAGDIIMFFNPVTDLSDEERDILKPLVEKGGRFYFLFDPVKTNADNIPNFMSLLNLYDVGIKKGLILEGDPTYYYSQNYPLILVPKLQSHAITDPISGGNIPVIIPQAGALDLPDAAPENTMTITSLLKTSVSSYLKQLDAESAEKTDADEAGPFDVAACIEKTNGTDPIDSVKIVVVYNTDFAVNSNITSYSENMTFFINGVNWMRNSEKEIYVRAKEITDSTLVFKNAVDFWMVVVISALLVPILMLVAGIVIYLKRKHL